MRLFLKNTTKYNCICKTIKLLFCNVLYFFQCFVDQFCADSKEQRNNFRLLCFITAKKKKKLCFVCLFCSNFLSLPSLGFVGVLLQLTLVQKEVGQTFRVKQPSPQVSLFQTVSEMQPYLFSVLTDKDYIVWKFLVESSVPKKSLKNI